MTLYLKYRPKNLDELDLPEVSDSLKKIVNSKTMPHAFLFAGPKGMGKTSAARILAKIINCEKLGKGGTPCDKCEQCTSIAKGTNLDVIEMDAASHRGIDDVRTLRDAVKLAPTKAKKKIYIIDEAHMLTTEASNALLKTLEEPPEHVVFILATTNPEKLIGTVRSRATLISFRKATPPEIARSLKRVIVGEKIKINEESLNKIVRLSSGAFRDAIKILEQFAAEGQKYLDRYKSSELDDFIDFLIKRDEKSAINEIEKSVAAGISMETFLRELLETFHKAILAEAGIGKNKLDGLTSDDLITLTDLFTEANRTLADSLVEELTTEIAVIKWCGGKDNRSQIVSSEKNSHPALGGVGRKIQTASAKDNDAQAISPSTDTLLTDLSKDGVGIVNDDIWKKILSEVHPVNASIEGLLRASCPVGYDGKTLTLGVFYKFHKERLEDVHHKKILEDVIEKVLNSPTKVICTLVEPPPKAEPVLTESRDNDIIKAAEEIFGNKNV